MEAGVRRFEVRALVYFNRSALMKGRCDCMSCTKQARDSEPLSLCSSEIVSQSFMMAEDKSSDPTQYHPT